MEKLYEILISFSNELYNHFSKLDTLTWNNFVLTLQYEIIAIMILATIVLMVVLCGLLLCLPIFIGKMISYMLMCRYDEADKTLCKIQMLYPLNRFKEDLDWLTTNGCSMHFVKVLYKKWCLIRRFNFLPAQKEFDMVLNEHKIALHKDVYFKILADFIKEYDYVSYVRDLNYKMQPIDEHVNEKMFPINIILWILWALLLIPIAIPLLV